MDNNGLKGEDNMLELGIDSTVKKAGEHIANRALNALVDGVKSRYGEAQVVLGTAFTRYLENATSRYNQVRTLATGTSSRTIIGSDSIYVNVGILHNGQKIETRNIESLLNISKNILIQGTGGIGKSMLMRYLFLNTADRDDHVPVLLELRKISNQSPEKISILDLIYSCMNDFDVKLHKEQFEYSLRLGKYVFLLDGFDEVKESHAKQTAVAIQKFCAKYPKNFCIITSRPGRDIAPLETFTVVESLPLSKEQSVLLASKIWKEDEKTTEFCKQLSDTLYDRHRDFAENPLLLSMMFLTFMRNNSIPNHLAEFYSKSYEALYSAHDSNDKGYYCREFKCKNLDEHEFKLILEHFCFQSYYKEEYEFTKDELINYLRKSIEKLEIKDVFAKDYLDDLYKVVCIIIKDGDIYRFSHRSFQAYFAACYTKNNLTDEQQEKLFINTLYREVFWEKEDYFELLNQIESQRFTVNALEKRLRIIIKELNSSPNLNATLVKMQFQAIVINDKKKTRNGISFLIGTTNGESYNYNIITLFKRYIMGVYPNNEESNDWQIIRECIDKIVSREKSRETAPLTFRLIDSSMAVSEQERQCMYDAIARINKINEVYDAIVDWLNEIDLMRESLAETDFIDNL